MNQKPETVSYYIYEADVARSEHHAKRMFIAFLITLAALILTNVGWIVYESQWQDEITVEQQAETGDAPIYQNGTGSLSINGESGSENN